MLTHFIVVEDVEGAGRFYADVLGGEVVMEDQPSIVALANGWVWPDRGEADGHARGVARSGSDAELS